MAKKLTEELINQIKETADIELFLKENEREFMKADVPEYLNNLINEKNLKVSEVAVRSGHGDYVYKVFQGTRKASRDVLICIAFGMALNLEETQRLLRIAETATLDPRNRRDSVVVYGLCKKLRITNVCSILYEFGEKIF